jgi:outer membrane protein assembly factor BamB
MPTRSVCLLLLVVSTRTYAADWPQFLGPTRDGHSPETGLKREWTKNGPAKHWEVAVGAGFSSPVVANGKAVLFHRVGDEEILDCWDAATGKHQWKAKSATGYVDDFRFDDGPRGTPAVVDGRVYSLGAEGRLACVQLDSGRPVWDRDLAKDYPFKKGYFGVGTSPIVDRERVYVNIGSKGTGVIALDRNTGKDIWRVSDDEASYSTPALAEIGGKTRLLCLTRKGLLVLNPADGNIEHDMYFRARIQASVNAATPLVSGSNVFLTASYNTGAILLEAGKNGWKEIWKSDDALSCHYNTPVKIGDIVYGVHGRQEYGPELRCIDWASGKVRWSKQGFGCASLIAVDGLLIAAVESGEVVLIEPTPDGYREKGRFQALEKPNHSSRPANALSMALSDGRLFVRDAKKLAVWDLKR